MVVTLEVRRAPNPVRHLRGLDQIRPKLQIRWRARQRDLHCAIGCDREPGPGRNIDRIRLAIEHIGTSAYVRETFLSNLKTGSASEEHRQCLTVSTVCTVAFAGREFQKSERKQFARIRGGDI